MARIIRCECGYVARGDSDEAVVTAIRAHMAADHPVCCKRSSGKTCSPGYRSSSHGKEACDDISTLDHHGSHPQTS